MATDNGELFPAEKTVRDITIGISAEELSNNLAFTAAIDAMKQEAFRAWINTEPGQRDERELAWADYKAVEKLERRLRRQKGRKRLAQRKVKQ